MTDIKLVPLSELDKRDKASRLADKYIGKDGGYIGKDGGAPSPDDERKLAELAEMSPLEYGRRREAIAKDLGIPLKYLDAERDARSKSAKADAEDADFLCDPEPWPEPVDGAELLNEIRDAAAKHIVLPEGGAEVIALWALFAHCYDCFDISPLLVFTSPTPECGKTTCLHYLGLLTPRTLSASNISPATVFRAVDKWKPTLLIDELDTFVGDNDEIRGILNCGHHRSGAFVLRLVGDAHVPTRFFTFSPKSLGLIGKLPPTLASRSIHVALKRMFSTDHIEPLRHGRTDSIDIFKRKAARWAVDHFDDLRAAEPEMPGSLYARAEDNWRPMVAIADAVGGGWPARTRTIAEKLGGRSEALAPVMVLEDLRAIFAEKGVELLKSEEATQALGRMEDRPWPEWKNEKPITTRQLATLLEPFGIAPKQRFADGINRRGYHVDQFDDAFKRWLGGDYAAMPLEPNESNTFSDSMPLEPTPHLAAREAKKPQKPNALSGIAARNPLQPVMREGIADKCTQCGKPGKLVPATDGAKTVLIHLACTDAFRAKMEAKDAKDANFLAGGLEGESGGLDDPDFEERAASLQYDGGLSRTEAEAQAAEEMPDLPKFLDRRRRAGL